MHLLKDKQVCYLFDGSMGLDQVSEKNLQEIDSASRFSP